MMKNASMSEPSPEPSDALLADLASKGDEAAFGALFDRFYARIRGYAARFLGDLADGEDIAQETFLRAARHLPERRAGSSVSGWLFRIATNLCRDSLRRKATRIRLEVPASDHDPHGRTEEVADALTRLPDDLRSAVLLVYFEGLSHGEAARVLGCAETTVSWRLMRARRQLKPLLKK